MKRKYFNDSSICWRIIGETRYEEEVGMLEKWESVKGTIKTMGKELSAGFDWAFDRLFSRIQLTNEQFVYVLLSVVFIVANAILWVQKFQGFPITATERPEVVYKAKTPADQIPHTARIMANGDQLYHDLVYMSAQKEDGTYDFHEIMSMSNPGYKRRIWPWVILREPLTPITICQVILSLMRRVKLYQPLRMLVMMSWIWDTTISWIQV